MLDDKSLEQEKQLIEAAKKDASKFLNLYDKYFDQIYRYIYRRTGGDKEITYDIVSETFLNSLKNLKKFQWKGYPFSSWLYKIAHNNVIKWYKKNRQHVPLDKAYSLSDSKQNQKEFVETKFAQAQIQEILNKLNEEEREILRLKFFEEVSNVEIAEIMGLSVSNVGVKVFRALKKAKSFLPNKSSHYE
jgi:RNA polymerase sigma-70 factor (ECF subfamily)